MLQERLVNTNVMQTRSVRRWRLNWEGAACAFLAVGFTTAAVVSALIAAGKMPIGNFAHDEVGKTLEDALAATLGISAAACGYFAYNCLRPRVTEEDPVLQSVVSQPGRQV